MTEKKKAAGSDPAANHNTQTICYHESTVRSTSDLTDELAAATVALCDASVDVDRRDLYCTCFDRALRSHIVLKGAEATPMIPIATVGQNGGPRYDEDL